MRDDYYTYREIGQLLRSLNLDSEKLDIVGKILSIRDIHTGDYIVHVFPLIETLLTLLYGLLFYVRNIHREFCSTITTRHQWLYFFWWIFCPLIPIGLYTLFFNPFVEYPTDINSIVSILIVIVLSIVYMISTFMYIYINDNIGTVQYTKENTVKRLPSVCSRNGWNWVV